MGTQPRLWWTCPRCNDLMPRQFRAFHLRMEWAFRTVWRTQVSDVVEAR